AGLLHGAAIIQGQDQILLRLIKPDPDQVLEPLGVSLRQVLGLGAVLVHVVQLPVVLVELALAAQRSMEASGLPAVLPDPTGPEHGVVLAQLPRRSVGVFQGDTTTPVGTNLVKLVRPVATPGVAHRDARERVLWDALVDSRHLQTAGL